MNTEPPIFSDAAQLAKIQQMVTNYLRLPFATDTIPGSLLEAIIGIVHGADVLKTYDFADVVKRGAVGWQVKSTKSETPVTWKRAKIPDKQQLIEASQQNDGGRQELGNALIDFCNEHALASLVRYKLAKIGYARLVIFPNGRIMYFERLLMSVAQPSLFSPADYVWRWSDPKRTQGKEQLPAFVGWQRDTGKKHFAWHGLGENQLHFSGEGTWWPLAGDSHRLDFDAPSATDKVSFETVAAWLYCNYRLSKRQSSDSPSR